MSGVGRTEFDDLACGHRRWYIVFSSRPKDVKATFFHRLFTSNEWSHVWAFCWDPVTGIYLTIDPRGNNLFVQPVPVHLTPAQVIKEISERPFTHAIVQFDKDEIQTYGFKYHGFYTCVSVMKDLLGIDNFLIQTPRALFKHLIKFDGVLIF